MEFGLQTGGNTTTYLDYHNGFASDYAARISSTGGSTTVGSATLTLDATAGAITLLAPAGATTLTNKPNQLTATGSEVVTADWVRQSIRPFVAAAITSGGVQSVTASTATTVNWTETSDLDNVFASNTFTVPTGGGGVYEINAYVAFSAGCTGILLATKINAGTPIYFAVNGQESGTNDNFFRVVGSAVLQLAVADTVVVQVTQLNSGAAARTLNINNLTIRKVGEIS
jgi:hypothetical protein